MRRITMFLLTLALALGATATARAAGTLSPVGSTDASIRILDHHVRVVINNGFAQTEVHQTFFNPNERDLEAIYSFPLPKSASLSEVTITAGERELHGEVLPRSDAEEIYEEERDQGQDAGLATKEEYKTFDFRVARVPAGGETKIRFVYYQPLVIDTGVGRYLYPTEDGGTDELAKSFWVPNTKVEGTLSFDVELISSWPVADLRVPGFESAATITEEGLDRYRVTLEAQGAHLERDFVLYYKLADDLPGRVELIPFRDDPDKPGTFMMVLTPGVDLAPLSSGSDYVFVLDTSGSMEGKIGTLARGVERAIGELDANDRFRIVTFSSRARELTRGWVPVDADNTSRVLSEVKRLRADGSTNLYDGLGLAFDRLDDDRTTSVILVTDAVTNTGVVDPREFHQLMKKVDVRVFGFLLGNNANWPLMRTIADSSGGFYAQISNADDVLGQVLLAKSKITHEALHDVEVKISGVDVYDTSDPAVGKVYRGEQVVVFGRYDKGGKATVTMKTRQSGQDQTYRTSFEFPEIDRDHPELERLWALHRIEGIEALEMAGLAPPDEAHDAIRSLGVEYQLVTDETAMIVLTDEAFTARGIDRANRARIAREREAQLRRAPQPQQSYRVDNSQPMYRGGKAPSFGSGAIDPATGGLVLALSGLGWAMRRRRR